MTFQVTRENLSPASAPLAFPVLSLPLLGASSETGRKPRGDDIGTEQNEVVVEVAVIGDDDGGGDAGPGAAMGQAPRRPLALVVIVPGDDDAPNAERRREGAEAPGGERRRGADAGHGGDQGQYGLDPLAHEEGDIGGGTPGPSESYGEAVDPAEGLTGGGDVCLGGSGRIEPGALDAQDPAVVTGDGGDKGGEALDGPALAIAQGGMEAQRREAATREPPGEEVGLGVGAADGAAPAPQSPGRPGGVIGVFGSIRCAVGTPVHGHGGRSQKGIRLGEGGTEGRGAGSDSDDVEEVAVLAGGGVAPLAGDAGPGEADEEGPTASAVEIAGDPVAALPAPVGEVSAADGLGVSGEGGRGGGGVHAAPPAGRMVRYIGCSCGF